MFILKFICVLLLLENNLQKVKSFTSSSGITNAGIFKDDLKGDSGDTENNSNDQTRLHINRRQGVLTDDINPDDEYEEGQTVDSLFQEEENCRILFSLGIKLINLNKNECLEQCLESDNCTSVSYKPETTTDDPENEENGPICMLNTERKTQAGPFYLCNNETSEGWNHYEKTPDYFLIFNKYLGKILKATSESTVALASKHEDECYWFWSGQNIYSKKYPTRLLTVKASDSQRAAQAMTIRYVVALQDKYEGVTQRWSYRGEDNLLKPIHDEELLLGMQGYGSNSQVVVGRNEDVHSPLWSLSLARSYFVLTNRESGNVMQAHNEDDSVFMSKYNGDDDQLWFWDDTNIRCKKFPDKVLQVEEPEEYFVMGHGRYSFRRSYGYVNIVTYVRGRVTQQWKADDEDEDETIQTISTTLPKRLCAKERNTNKGVRVISCPSGEGERKDKWTFSSARMYFFILEKSTGKVISAETARTVSLETYNFRKEQLWFWDQDVIRNKRYTGKVLTMDNSRRVQLNEFNGEDTQTWSYDGDCLISNYNELKLHARDSSITGNADSTQEWSITISHDFFTIWNKHSGQVLDVSQENTDRREVITWQYHGLDHQRWFWDDRNIRSKKYPNKVLQMNSLSVDASSNWVVVQMITYNGEPNQNWRHNGNFFINDRQSRHLSVKEFSPTQEDKKMVGGCVNCNDFQREHFSYSSQAPVYFTLQDIQNNNFLSFNWTVPSKLRIEVMNDSDTNYWFLEGQNIRSKRNPKYVLTLKKSPSSDWWSLTADRYQELPIEDKFQLFSYDNEHHIIAQLDGFQIEYHNGYGGYEMIGRPMGNKRIRMVMVEEPEPEEESCINETEQKIYKVVEWIPLISTLWDLFSSIGYGIAGCDSVAQERAISMSIGVVTDIGTALTFGTGSAAFTALKTGVKVGIKLGMKAGLKASVTVAKTSIKAAFRKTISRGFLQGLKKGLQRTGKFIAKETIIDPAMFLKNIGKVSKQVLTRPKKSFVQICRAGKQGIEDLKNLRKKLLDAGEDVCQVTRNLKIAHHKSHQSQEQLSQQYLLDNLSKHNTRHEGNSTKRSCFGGASSQLLKDGKTELGKLSDPAHLTEETIDVAKNRYGQLIDPDEYARWKGQGEKPRNLVSELDFLEAYAVYKYSMSPDINMFANGLLYDVTAMKNKVKQAGEEKMDEIINQAILMQDWLKKHPMNHPDGGTRVYRFEPKIYVDKYVVGEEYVDNTMVSTTREINPKKAFNGAVTNENRPRQLTILLKTTGTDIASYAQVPAQKEVVIPFGTRFRCTSRRKVDIDGVKVTQIEIEEAV